LPLGYNHDYMVDAASRYDYDQYLLQKPVISKYPPFDYYNRLRKVLAIITPNNLPEAMLTCNSPNQGLELAIRTALSKWYEKNLIQERNVKGISILTFENSSEYGTLLKDSASFGNINTISVPLPLAKLPIGLHVEENNINEQRILHHIEETINGNEQSNPIGAIIVEPILNKTGHYATRDFYKKLRIIAKNKGIPFIINEIHTGGGVTGKFWASDQWECEDRADFLVFGKKLHMSGYFTTPDYRPLNKTELVDNFSDVGWKLIQLEAFLKGMTNRQLIERTTDCGSFIKLCLQRIEKEKQFIANVRGQGTFISFDVVRGEKETDNLLDYLKSKGVYVRKFDKNTIALRPALILEPIHAEFFIDALRKYPYKETIKPIA